MSSSSGLRGMIWDQIPESWKFVLTKHHAKTEFVEAVYKSIPKNRKGNHWMYGKTYLRCHGILTQKYHMLYTVYPNSKKPKAFWQQIKDEIETYEFNLR